MNEIRETLTRKLKYCTVQFNAEFDDCLDICDIASDYPFCSVYHNIVDDPYGIGMSANFYDVCRVDVCHEYGNDVRDDRIIAKSCTLAAVVDLVVGMHIKVTPAKRAAYKHIKNSTYADAGTIFNNE